ncbi:MCE family protein [Nocardia sp. NPDC050712]|uniref:MCE family protein n=1 Tax=Nocardia sp. NPDC050712 TaxID=3155518 RepID=UPI0033E7CD16
MGSTARSETDPNVWREFARVTWQLLRLKIAGAALVLTLVTLVVVVLAMYSGRFTSTVRVTVETARSGLVLNPDAKVAFRGVEIGRVAAVERVDGGVRLRLDLDPDQVRLVPGNARVDIRSTTVFGAKFVNFVTPERPSRESLRPGAVLRADSVTVELNTVFEHLSELLAKVDPVHLNATLAALGAALEGRGEKLGDLLARSDAYLRELNPSLPALRRDLAAAAEVTNLYADTVGDLLRTAANAVATSATIVDQQADLDAVLVNLIGLAGSSGAVLRENEQRLTTALDLLRPTTVLLGRYAPVLHCVITSLAETLPLADGFVGGIKPGAIFRASFQFGSPPYRYPDDLPKVNATGGPSCHGVLEHIEGMHSDYLVTDTNQGRPFTPSTALVPNAPKVFQLLFAGLPGVTG